MSDEKIVSLSGSPVYQHGEPEAWQPPHGEMCLEQIGAHIAAHLGPVPTVFHELVSDTVHIDVHQVPPTDDFPFWRLVTSGMSDLPMSVPEGMAVPRHLELIATLPGTWKMSQADFQDENWYWPVRLLKSLARLPHKHSTWLAYGHTVGNAEPPEPYASNTRLCASILLPPISAPRAFDTLVIDESKTIEFLAVVPLYPEETSYKLDFGLDKLLAQFSRHRIEEVVDIKRVNTCRRKKWFGLF
mgnify:CR=1 FL=1